MLVVASIEFWATGLAIFSVVGFAVGLISLPWVVIRIPADYFVCREAPVGRFQSRHPALRIGYLVAKNLLGATLIVAGILMLFLPGQGVLTILLGLWLTDVPGKRALERRLIGSPPVFRAVNALRRRVGHPPILSPRDDCELPEKRGEEGG